MSIWVDQEYHRAGAGGTGAAKCGGNYAASLLPQQQAYAKGFEQVCFLDASTNTQLEELGGMNVFVVHADGSVATPPVSGSILEGVTRSSILRLLTDAGHEVSERQIPLTELREGLADGSVREVFACGTAAVMTPDRPAGQRRLRPHGRRRRRRAGDHAHPRRAHRHPVRPRDRPARLAAPARVMDPSANADLAADVDRIAAESDFAGVVRVDRAGTTELSAAYGLADRRHGIAMTPDSQVGIASGSKGMTALAVMSLVEDGTLSLGTTARSLLGTDLPLIADDVTVEHLLAHTSGIGDYLDEDDDIPISAYAMTVPVHELATTEQFLRVLDGFPTAFPAGERFFYCNGGFVVLALLAERASGVPFHDLVRERVCRPAGLVDTDFLRSDALPGRAALGYVEMDGAVADQRVPPAGARHGRRRDLHDGCGRAPVLDRAVRRRDRQPGRAWPRWCGRAARRPTTTGGTAWGSGCTRPRDVVQLEGYDAGASFLSQHDPPSRAHRDRRRRRPPRRAWPLAKAAAGAADRLSRVSRSASPGAACGSARRAAATRSRCR